MERAETDTHPPVPTFSSLRDVQTDLQRATNRVEGGGEGSLRHVRPLF